MPSFNSTQRFSDRGADSVRYQPGYPAALLQTLVDESGLTTSSVVADIESGTGISADLFLRQGCEVFGVEPHRVSGALTFISPPRRIGSFEWPLPSIIPAWPARSSHLTPAGSWNW